MPASAPWGFFYFFIKYVFRQIVFTVKASASIIRNKVTWIIFYRPYFFTNTHRQNPFLSHTQILLQCMQEIGAASGSPQAAISCADEKLVVEYKKENKIDIKTIINV